VRFEHVRTFGKPYTYADSCFVCTATDEHERNLCGFDSEKDLYDNYYESLAPFDSEHFKYTPDSFIAELRAKGLLSYDEEENIRTNGKQQLVLQTHHQMRPHSIVHLSALILLLQSYGVAVTTLRVCAVSCAQASMLE
jgi:hypothetical protein